MHPTRMLLSYMAVPRDSISSAAYISLDIAFPHLTVGCRQSAVISYDLLASTNLWPVVCASKRERCKRRVLPLRISL